MLHISFFLLQRIKLILQLKIFLDDFNALKILKKHIHRYLHNIFDIRKLRRTCVQLLAVIRLS